MTLPFDPREMLLPRWNTPFDQLNARVNPPAGPYLPSAGDAFRSELAAVNARNSAALAGRIGPYRPEPMRPIRETLNLTGQPYSRGPAPELRALNPGRPLRVPLPLESAGEVFEAPGRPMPRMIGAGGPNLANPINYGRMADIPLDAERVFNMGGPTQSNISGSPFRPGSPMATPETQLDKALRGLSASQGGGGAPKAAGKMATAAGKAASALSPVLKFARVASQYAPVLGAWDLGRQVGDRDSDLHKNFWADEADAKRYWGEGEVGKAAGATARQYGRAWGSAVGTMTGAPAMFRGLSNFAQGVFGSDDAPATKPSASAPPAARANAQSPAEAMHPATDIDPLAAMAKAYPNMRMAGQLYSALDNLPKMAKGSKSTKDILGERLMNYGDAMFEQRMAAARTPQERAAIAEEWDRRNQGMNNSAMAMNNMLFNPDDNR